MMVSRVVGIMITTSEYRTATPEMVAKMINQNL